MIDPEACIRALIAILADQLNREPSQAEMEEFVTPARIAKFMVAAWHEVYPKREML